MSVVRAGNNSSSSNLAAAVATPQACSRSSRALIRIRMLSRRLCLASVVLIWGCMGLCQAARVPLSTTAANQLGDPLGTTTAPPPLGASPGSSNAGGDSSSHQCGQPNALCGSYVPSGVTCEQGQGWCTTGYYCAPEDNSSVTAVSRCLPLQGGCGQAGNPCCPSNTDTPHTWGMQKIDRKPFCRDNSTCFYDSRMLYMVGDIFAGVPGSLGCAAVPADCGIGPGSPCCPNLYLVTTNPPLPRSGCPDNTFCDFDPLTPAFPGSALLLERPGTCVENDPDCGQLGKPCCVSNLGASTGLRCVVEGGQRGYCADATGLTLAQGAREKDLVCTLCPAVVDETLRFSDPDTFVRCGLGAAVPASGNVTEAGITTTGAGEASGSLLPLLPRAAGK